jgi:hypothetical protein
MAAKSHKDVEFIVLMGRDGHKTFKNFDEAAAFAVARSAATDDRAVLDVLVYSRAGAKWYEGDYGVEKYDEDPEASVFERINIRATVTGRIA